MYALTPFSILVGGTKPALNHKLVSAAAYAEQRRQFSGLALDENLPLAALTVPDDAMLGRTVGS